MVPPRRGEVEATDENQLCGGQEMAGTVEGGKQWSCWHCPDVLAMPRASWEDRGL